MGWSKTKEKRLSGPKKMKFVAHLVNARRVIRKLGHLAFGQCEMAHLALGDLAFPKCEVLQPATRAGRDEYDLAFSKCEVLPRVC